MSPVRVNGGVWLLCIKKKKRSNVTLSTRLFFKGDFKTRSFSCECCSIFVSPPFRHITSSHLSIKCSLVHPPFPPLLHFTCFPTSFSALSLPPPSFTIPPLPPFSSLVLYLCCGLCLSLHHSLLVVWWCCPGSLPNCLPLRSSTPTPPSLPPNAINTQHRWVIAQTYRLPLPLLPSLFPSLLCSSLLPGLTHFPTSMLALASLRPSWAKPGPAPSVVQPSPRAKPKVILTHYNPRKTNSAGVHTIWEHSQPKSRASHSLTSQLRWWEMLPVLTINAL